MIWTPDQGPPPLSLAAKALLLARADPPPFGALAMALSWSVGAEGAFAMLSGGSWPFQGTNNFGSIHASRGFAAAHASDLGFGMVAFLDHGPGVSPRPLRVFPVGAEGHPHYSDDFGYVKPIAPAGSKGHQGTDIFADFGAPVLAVDDGELSFTEDPLGGHVFYLRAAGGTVYYGAHLSAYAGADRSVRAGEVVGFVGQSGNAHATSPHLHFEVHPGGGPGIDPFPWLQLVTPQLSGAVVPLPPTAAAAPGIIPYITRMAVYPSLLAGAKSYLDLVGADVDLETVKTPTDFSTSLYVHNYFSGFAPNVTPVAGRAAAAASGQWTADDLANIAAGAALVNRALPVANTAIAAAASEMGDPSLASGGPFASLAVRLTPSDAYGPHTLAHARTLLGASADHPPPGGISLASALAHEDGVWKFGGSAPVEQRPEGSPWGAVAVALVPIVLAAGTWLALRTPAVRALLPRAA